MMSIVIRNCNRTFVKKRTITEYGLKEIKNIVIKTLNNNDDA